MDADAAAAPCRKPASHSLPKPPLLFAVRARSGRVADLGAGGPAFSGPPDTPPPPALFAVRARSGRLADLGAGGAAFSGPPDTPPRPSLVTVPFLWEEAPGMPKASRTACAAAKTPAAADVGPVPEGETGDRQDSSGHADQTARTQPLKLPPRLQQVPASFAAADTRQGSGHVDQARPLPPLKLPPRLQQVSASFAAADTPLSSPSTVLQGPYYARAGGGRRTPRWARSGGAALRRTTSAGVALFSRTWSKRRAAAPAAGRNKNRCDIHERDAAGPDAPWYSPASPSSSSSSVSTCFGGDDHGRGRPADDREVASEEDDGSPRRITRFRLRRNRSLPSMSTSNLWASIRRSVKQITPWS